MKYTKTEIEKEIISEDEKNTVPQSQINNIPKNKSNNKFQEPLIYIGESIPGVAFTRTIFSNGLPLAILDLAKKIPAINSLVVPLSQAAAAISEIERMGGATYACYKAVIDYLERREV